MDLSPYLPIDRRFALAESRDLPDRVSGSALLADITGYTPLAAALVADLGSERGVEELTRRLNIVYASLIDQVHAYRGSIVNFGGDAIYAWFDGDDGIRAVTCALAMQSTQSGPAIPGGDDLSIQVSVVAGSARRFVVGSPQIQTFDVLAGRLLEQLARVEEATGDGEVVVAAHVVEGLGVGIGVREWRQINARPERFAVVSEISKPAQPDPWPQPLPQLPLSLTRHWLPPAVYQRLLHGEAQFLADLRPAAALFLRFDNLAYDAAPNGGELDRCVQWVQTVAQQYGGTLIDLTVSDRGTYLYVAFGAPVAHDNNGERAVAAALTLRRPPGDLPAVQGVQIGVTHGRVRAGAYGSPRRQTYGVLGSPVNLAARLVGVAPAGEIRCDFETYRAAGKLWQFEALLPVRVKGRAELIRVYRPSGLRTRSAERYDASGRNRFVGRWRERVQLEQLLDTVAEGRDQIMIVSGEPGIGKSRLVMAFIEMIRERGLAGLQGAGSEIETRTPYQAWRDILGGFFDIEQMADRAARERRVREVVQTIAPDQLSRLPLLNPLLDLHQPETALTAALDADLRQQSLSLLVVALLRAWARERPLILVLEDAQWLDSLSWELAIQVSRSLSASEHAFALLVAIRPPEPGALGRQALDRLRGATNARTIALGPLGQEAMVELIAANLALVPAQIPPELATFVHRRSAGNPFFAREIVFALREQHILEVQASHLSAVPGQLAVMVDLERAGDALPGTLQGLILARLDRLPPELRWLLKVAAVIGSTFTLPPLVHVMNQYQPVAPEDLAVQIEALVERDLLQQASPELDDHYAFRHVMLQQVSYQTLLHAQRQEVHGLVLGWYEQAFLDEWLADQRETRLAPATARFLPLLVHHARQAGDPAREQHYAWMAGQQAAGQQAYDEAVAFFTRVLDLTHDDDRALRRQVLEAREEANHVLSNRAAQVADLEALSALAAQSGSTETQARVALRSARYYERMSDYETAIAATRRAIGLAQRSSSLELLARAQYERGMVRIRQSNYVAAQKELQAALHSAQSVGALQVEADTVRAMGVALAYQGKYRESHGHYQQALELYRAAGNLVGQSQALDNIGSTLHYLGDMLEARAYYEQSLEISRRLGDRHHESSTLNNLGLFYDAFGDFSSARTHLEASRLIAREVGDRHGENLALSNLAGVDYAQGDFLGGETRARQALTIAMEIGAEQDAAGASHALGNNLLGQARYDAAAEAFREAITLRKRVGQPHAARESQAGLASALYGAGAPAAAQAEVDEVLAFLSENGNSGMEELFRIYIRCYQVLDINGDPRASTLLLEASQMLLDQANRISDAALRQAYLQNVPDHQTLLALAADVAPVRE